jgi:TetR/AcrR family transcriptional repressor of nem operon
MRVTRAQAEENRRTVIDAASRLFRERGFDGIGLSDLMRAAGLTHGGFYKQFSSKDDLIAQACDRALSASVDKWTRVVDSGQPDVLAALVRNYLARSHRERVGDGCPLAALGPDVVRADPALRHRFEHTIRWHADTLGQAMAASPARAQAHAPLAALSMMVGALLLSRMVEDEALAADILDSAAASLTVLPRS